KSLQEAMKGKDIRTARELRQRWQEESPIANLGADGSLGAAVTKSLEWLADMETLLTKLRAADLDAEDINYQYWLMDRWQKYLPTDLENAYQERVKQIERASAVRERVIVIATSIVCAVILFIVILLVLIFAK